MAASQDSKPEQSIDTGGLLLKLVIAVLFMLLLGLQYRLWVGEGSLAETSALSAKVAIQKRKNDEMRDGNQQLAAEVKALKNGFDEVEARAREELGMIKSDETFYLLVEQNAANN